MENQTRKLFKLQGRIQHYSWGGSTYLSELLRMPNPQGRPFAEYWMGAHDNASAEIATGDDRTTPLNEYIQADPNGTLGQQVARRFGRLPFLLKILDVKDMLSIQVHPSKKHAELEFAEENRRQIPRDAPNRNYKDDNHKPELMVALSEFWLLHGFKSPDRMADILKNTPELAFLLQVFENQGYQALYQAVMEMDQRRVNETLQPLLLRIIPRYQQNLLTRQEEDFWAARAALTYNRPGHIDRGIFSIYFFNLLHLYPGEALFQDAGLPHAYMEGQNVEIMANSDNVLRGGLTTKHIDVNELLKHIRFEPTLPRVDKGTLLSEHMAVYLTPAPDFELSRITLSKGESLTLPSYSTGIYILMEGLASVTEAGQPAFYRKPGESWLAFDGAQSTIQAADDAVIYRAAVPVIP